MQGSRNPFGVFAEFNQSIETDGSKAVTSGGGDLIDADAEVYP
jgi:hypothetical protein